MAAARKVVVSALQFACSDDFATAERMQKLAEELGVVIPVSFFEEANNAYYNSVAIIDADGTDLGLYRKSHIPDGPGYQEKFYFNPGDTGFKAFQTKFAKIGVAICWDQWFPEASELWCSKVQKYYSTRQPLGLNLKMRDMIPVIIGRE
ncbi:N-carbamoylputrescine amidase-like protein [Drosera capensis]